MNIRKLEIFYRTAKCLNMSQVAKDMYISQPSISQCISEIESEVDAKLFDRIGKKLYLTHEGQIFYEYTRRILNIYEEGINVIRSSKSNKGKLVIGASTTIGTYIMPYIIHKFNQKEKDIEISMIIDNKQNIEELILNNKVDIGFIEGISSYSNLNQEYLSEDKMVLAVPYNSYWINNKFNFDLLQNQNWVAREEGSGTREYLNLFLNSNKITPKNLMILGSNYAVKEAVRNGLGITIISNFVAHPAAKNKELITIELDKSYYRSFSYILPKNINVTKATEVFLKEFKSYLLDISK